MVKMEDIGGRLRKNSAVVNVVMSYLNYGHEGHRE